MVESKPSVATVGEQKPRSGLLTAGCSNSTTPSGKAVLDVVTHRATHVALFIWSASKILPIGIWQPGLHTAAALYTCTMDQPKRNGIELVGFDADDTLWRSQDYFDAAQVQFERIISAYVDLTDIGRQLYEYEARNIAIFGYGVKGMVLSMVEAAVVITNARISAADIHRIVELGKELLRHPVEVLPGVREAVEAIARDFPVVLITKGDLFHQEAKVRDSGLSDLFGRIEIVSEKDPVTYARVLSEFDIAPQQFLMVGNSLRSDIAPVLELGGWGVHVPYHVTWAHEAEGKVDIGVERMRSIARIDQLAEAVEELKVLARIC